MSADRKMRRLIIVSKSLLPALLFWALAAAVSGENLHNHFQARSTRLIVGGDGTFPPFEYTSEECQPASFNVLGNDSLTGILNEGLHLIRATGEYRSIHEQWFGRRQQGGMLPLVSKFILLITVPLAIAALIMLLANRMLRKMVAARSRELRERTELQQAMIACSPLAMYSVDLKGMVTCWNKMAERMFGWREDEVLGRRLPILPDSEIEHSRELAEKIAEGTTYSAVESMRIKKDGALLPTQNYYAAIRDSNGEIVGIMAATEDLTDRLRNEKTIDHLNKVLRSIRNVNQLINHTSDRETLLHRACESLTEHRGYHSAWIGYRSGNSKSIQLAQSNFDCYTAEFDEMLKRGDWPACIELARKSDKGIAVAGDNDEICATCPTGIKGYGTEALIGILRHATREYGMLVVTLPSHRANKPEDQQLFKELADDMAYALFNLDLQEERHKTDQALREAQKLESIGRLAGGVAHDFNNMLMVIMSYVQMCRDEVGETEPLSEWLDEVYSASERSAKLTAQLLAFARKQIAIPKQIDINESAENALKMLRRIIGENIELTWRPGRALERVDMDPHQVDQILTNLCVNARDAINGDGQITVATMNAVVEEGMGEKNLDAQAGEYVLLEISDSGCGMDQETVAQAFEPFFTTKPVGEGTGLGLSMVYGIVRQNSGFVNVESEIGVGTKFSIYIPKVSGECKVPDEEASIDAEGGETILLVEDEESICTAVKRFMGKMGYNVIALTDPKRAIAEAQKLKGKLDVLVSDVIMPGMNGPELAETIARICPNAKIIFISGHKADAVIKQRILERETFFMPKPFTPYELAIQIRKVLDGA